MIEPTDAKMEKFNWKTVGLTRQIKIGPVISKWVHQGMFQKQHVAVKSIHFNQKEAEMLRKLNHPNVIRIHYTDAKENTLYMVLDYCKYTLRNYVEDKTEIDLNRIEVLRQTTLGLDYLHNGQKFCTVHRDLKPSNILFEWIEREKIWRVKISDFGISKEFERGKTSTDSDLKGSQGFVAPELLDRADCSPGPGKIRKAIDIFSLGVIFYYVLSKGKHPFTNDPLEYSQKIRDGKPKLDDLMKEYAYDAEFIILAMICKDWEKRISIGKVLAHHLFWDAKKKCDFFQKVSDIFEDRKAHQRTLNELEKMWKEVASGNWKDCICGDDFNPVIKTTLQKRNPSWEKKTSLQDLLRLIRNWAHHYHDASTIAELKEELGDYPDGFIRFFTSSFPKLLSRLYQFMHKLKDHESLKIFYGVETAEADDGVKELLMDVVEDVSGENQATATGSSRRGGESPDSEGNMDIEDDDDWGTLEEVTPKEAVQESGSEKEVSLVLREYQKELTEQAASGKNSLIIAPTGSGKTAVANEIIKNHLKSGESRSILFFVSKTTLARQQYEFFSRHLREHLKVMDIAYLIGEMTTNVAVGAIMKQTKLIILTPQILIDELNRSMPFLSFDDISMMIFDECHNTTGKHPYKVIMDMYMDFQFKNRSSQQIQVIGMTASPGVGNGKTREKVLENLVTLLASLNVTQRPAVVERNIEELKEYKNQIEESFVRVNVGQDVFTMKILEAISVIENRVAKSGVIGIEAGQRPKPPVEKDKQKYENWVVDLRKYATLKEDDRKLSRSLNLFAIHLKMYHNLLYLKKLIPHAIDVVAPDLNLDQQGNTGRNLYSIYSQLRGYSEDSDVPLLSKLLEILREEFRKAPASRCIIFVPRRVIAPALVEVIKLSIDLGRLEPKSLTGSNEQAERGGMTKNEQEDALKAFHAGESKILIATSVAEEGLDIPACNLVIMYNYVTGEVGKIQRAGRGRAESSRSILISSYGSEQFKIENRNKICAIATETAIQDLKDLTAEERERRIEKVQIYEMVARQTKSTEHERRLHDAKNWKVLCGLCRAALTRGDQIRHIKNQHRFVVDEKFLDCVHRRPCKPEPMAPGQPFERVATFSCRECNNRIGVDMQHNKTAFPTLSIKELVFEDEQGQRRSAKQWSKCPFAVEKAVHDVVPPVDLQAIRQFVLTQAKKVVVKGFVAEDADEEDTKEFVAIYN